MESFADEVGREFGVPLTVVDWYWIVTHEDGRGCQRLNETWRTGKKEEAKLGSFCLRMALSHVRHQEDTDWFIFFEPIQATAAEVAKWHAPEGHRRMVEDEPSEEGGGAQVAPKREREAAAESCYRGSEPESEAGEDPAGGRRSFRQVKLEDQKSRSRTTRRHVLAILANVRFRAGSLVTLCDVFTIGAGVFNIYSRTPQELVCGW